MAIKVPGSMAGLQYVMEDEYGVTPSGDLRYAGRMRTLDGTFDPHPEELEPDNSREFSDVIFTNEDHGFSTDLSVFADSGDYSWTDVLMLTFGDLSSPQDEIPTFSSLIQVARDQYFLARGCAVDSLELSAEGVGKQIRAALDVVCKRIDQPVETRPDVGGDAPNPSSPPITYTSYPTTTITGAAKIPAKSWMLTINNNMASQEGFDADGLPLTAGSGIVPGRIEITHTLEVMSSSLLWDRLKMDRTQEFDINHVISGYNVTLTGCYLTGGDMPPRSNMETYDETITVKARSVSVSKITGA